MLKSLAEWVVHQKQFVKTAVLRILVVLINLCFNLYMKRFNLPRSLLLFVFLFFLSFKDSNAYIDPGAGSYFLQIIMAGVFSLLFFVKKPWILLKSLFARFFNRTKNSNVNNEEK